MLETLSVLDAYQFLLKLRRVRSLVFAARQFRNAVAPIGFDTFACGELDLTNRSRNVYYVIDWPDKWRHFYLNSDLINRDPVVDSLAYRHEPYTWTDLRKDRRFGKLGRETLSLAEQHGWTQGFVVPIPSIGNRVGLVSLAGTCTEISAETRAHLTFVCLAFHYQVRLMVTQQGFAAPPAGLTEREIDCIHLAANGHSDKGIARILGVAPSTTHEFVEKAKQRLSSHTRSQMIAMAVSLGIVDPFQQRDPSPAPRRPRRV